MAVFLHKMSGPGTAGDVWICTMHSSGAGSLATVHTAWSTFVQSIVTGSLGAVWTPAVSITSLSTVQLDPITGKQTAATSSGVALVGTASGTQPSPRDSIVLSKRTVVPTKAGRGRMYLPGPAGASIGTNGLLIGSVATTIANSIGNALTIFKSTSQPVIFHKTTKTVDNITYVAVGTVLGTQTRRTNRVFNAYATKTI